MAVQETFLCTVSLLLEVLGPCPLVFGTSLSNVSTLSDTSLSTYQVICLPFHLAVMAGRCLDSFPDPSLSTRGHFPFFCNWSQWLSQQSMASDFIRDGSSSLQSELGHDFLERWRDRFWDMPVQGIQPLSF